MSWAFAVYDRKAQFYSVPFFQRSRGEALRAFQQLAERDDTLVGRFPEDFDLVCLCEFDEKSGVFGQHLSEHLSRASEVRRMPRKESVVMNLRKEAEETKGVTDFGKAMQDKTEVPDAGKVA